MSARTPIRDRIDRQLLLGLVVVGVAVLITYVSIVAIDRIPFSHPYRLRAEVPASAPLLKSGDEVRIAGQRAGQVREIGFGPHGAPLVSMDLDHGPVGRDAHARVRLRGLAGATYVEIDPGNVGDPMPSAGTIPLAHSGTGIGLTDVIDAFDPRTTRGLRTTLERYGVGLAGRGPDINRALGDLPAALSGLTPIMRAATPRPGALAGLLQGLRHTVRGFATPGRRDLGGLLGPTSVTFATFATHAPALQRTIDLLRPVGDAAAGTLPVADRLLDRVVPAVRSLTPGMRALARALPDVDALLAQRNGISSLAALARRATPVLAQAAPLLRELAVPAGTLAPLAMPLRTLSAYLAPYASDLLAGPTGFTNWGRFTYDAGQAPGARAVRFAPVFTCMRERDPYPAPGAALKDEQPCRP